ncbi:MAG: PorT family protein [Bacteroidetes bacterium]|nr:MAG: PorT family protein [Bacteroidota bacterium]
MRNLTHFACLLAFLMASALYGQGSRVSGSLFGGAAFSTVHPDPSDAFEPHFRTGYVAGVQIRWMISEHWGLPLNLQLAQRGYYYNTEGTFLLGDNGQLGLYRGRIDYRLGYLEMIPQVEWQPVGYFGIAAGPYLSYRMTEEVQYGEVVDWTDTKEYELYKDTDFGIAARLQATYGRISAFAGFQFGLADISNITLTDANGQPVRSLGLKNRSVSTGLAFRI